jgi:hypothetical protein
LHPPGKESPWNRSKQIGLKGGDEVKSHAQR